MPSFCVSDTQQGASMAPPPTRIPPNWDAEEDAECSTFLLKNNNHYMSVCYAIILTVYKTNKL